MQCFFRLFIYNIIIIITISTTLAVSNDSAFSSPESNRSVIVIDPGHGGFDNGANGADKSLEKSISYSAATILKETLEKQYNVVLTRTGDYWVDNKKRTEVANNHSAKLFISLHTGAAFTRETKGVSFLFFKQGALKSNRNIADDTSGKSTEWHSVQERHIPLSRVLTESLYTRFSKIQTYGQPKTGSLPIPVLSGADMPAVLIEIGYLTNPADEQRLNNSDFLSDYMKEIASEIELFLKKYNNSY